MTKSNMFFWGCGRFGICRLGVWTRQGWEPGVQIINLPRTEERLWQVYVRNSHGTQALCWHHRCRYVCLLSFPIIIVTKQNAESLYNGLIILVSQLWGSRDRLVALQRNRHSPNSHLVYFIHIFHHLLSVRRYIGVQHARLVRLTKLTVDLSSIS